jgi:hypothetical protein
MNPAQAGFLLRALSLGWADNHVQKKTKRQYKRPY